MDSQKLQKAMIHFEKHWRYKPCPCCGSIIKWELKDKLTVMPHVKDQGIDQNSVYAYITATCGKCFYSIFFNAEDAGIS